MTTNGWIQIFVFLAVILAITKPLGVFMAKVLAVSARFSILCCGPPSACCIASPA